jgi:alpha-tubulin suppressor-like RCC1 family protein
MAVNLRNSVVSCGYEHTAAITRDGKVVHKISMLIIALHPEIVSTTQAPPG